MTKINAIVRDPLHQFASRLSSSSTSSVVRCATTVAGSRRRTRGTPTCRCGRRAGRGRPSSTSSSSSSSTRPRGSAPPSSPTQRASTSSSGPSPGPGTDHGSACLPFSAYISLQFPSQFSPVMFLLTQPCRRRVITYFGPFFSKFSYFCFNTGRHIEGEFHALSIQFNL